MRSEGVPEAFGRGPGPFWVPRVLPGRKLYPKSIDLTLPRGQVGDQNSHFSDMLVLILALIFREAFGKASRTIFG